MSTLRPPGLGPIIGHTTASSCRFWIRAGDPEDSGVRLSGNRRTIGVIGLLSGDRSKIEVAYYFRLHREFDRTGTFVLGKDVSLGRQKSNGIPAEQVEQPVQLQPDTPYTVRMATLTIDDPMPDAESLSSSTFADRLPPIEKMAPLLLDLPPELCEATVVTFPAEDVTQERLSFLLGSCRYPGLLWKVKDADRIFAPMKRHFADQVGLPAARFSLMVGDQIYADLFNRLLPIGRADTYEEFQERYIEAFGSPNMRRLLRTAPTYMILDDHEIEDNWSQDRIKEPGLHRLFNYAIGAYMSYQWSHGPRSYGRLLYYRFDCAGYPFFVLDTRTQRYRDDEGLDDNHLLGRPTIDPMHTGQLQRLTAWLEEQQRERGNAPKFIASPSVFAPNSMDERLPWSLSQGGKAEKVLFQANDRKRGCSDSWPAYPNTRQAILERILDCEIQNVVFLTGDIHCSNIAQLTFKNKEGDHDLHAYDITSSAFYWPFPFADGNPNNYVHDSKEKAQLDGFPVKESAMHYEAWAFTQEDNFCRIDIDKVNASLCVRYYDRQGDPVEVSDKNGNPVHENRLSLATW